MPANANITTHPHRPRRNVANIAEAHQYHRLIGENANDPPPEYDSSIEAYSFDYECTIPETLSATLSITTSALSWGSDHDENDDENRKTDNDEDDDGDGDEDSPANEGGSHKKVGQPQDKDANERPLIKLRKILHEHPLLNFIPSQSTPRCRNSIANAQSWTVEPDFKLKRHGMGFLSQIAHLCLEARIGNCTQENCLTKAKDMEQTAPECQWLAFREWAITAMSCQAAMDSEQAQSRAHTHIAIAVNACFGIIRGCNLSKTRDSLLRPYLDGDSDHTIDLHEVFEIIYWMGKIQRERGVGPRKFGHWTHALLPAAITLPDIEAASRKAESLGICKTRLWNLINISDRKQSDFPAIVRALGSQSHGTFKHTGHEYCSPGKCQWSQMNTTSVKQLHKCAGSDCETMHFRTDLLVSALDQGKPTAWKYKPPQLVRTKDHYVAISHVWSDGTGSGRGLPGVVNKCLVKYFGKLAEQLGCNAFWWDVISIPIESSARSKALEQMHNNYATAKCTIVHDQYLLEVPWKDDGSPCLALVLSNWFTRGWTALELFMSSVVKVIFKNPNGEGTVLKDLDDEILAKSPEEASRAYWLATTLIQQLRKPVKDVGDLLSILSPRSTSFFRDRTVIAALLAEVPNCDFTAGESKIVSQILRYIGKIPYMSVLHGKPTMCSVGAYSWSAATLDEMPVDISKDMEGDHGAQPQNSLAINDRGAIEGVWWCRELVAVDIEQKKIQPHGNDLSAIVKIEIALRHWSACILLRPYGMKTGHLALMVVPFKVLNLKRGPVLKCRYIGTVVESDKDPDHEDGQSGWIDLTVRIGDPDSGTAWKDGAEALDEMESLSFPGEQKQSAERATSVSDSDIDPENAESARPFPNPLRAIDANPPPWLKHANSSESLKSHNTTDTSHSPEASTKELFTAVWRRNKGAMRYLIRQNVRFDDGELEKWIEEIDHELREGRDIWVGLKMLGDVLEVHKQYKDAIHVYNKAIGGYDSVTKQGKDQLPACKARYALGSVYVKNGSRTDYEKARELFLEVLTASDGRKPSKSRKGRNPHEPKPPEPPKDTKTATNKNKSGTGDKSEKRQNNEWYRLELNTVAQLTALCAATFRFDEAAGFFNRALKGFGKTPQINDVFWVNSTSRSREDAEGKARRDEETTWVYQKAYRRFQLLFRGKNLIVGLTALHLGTIYKLRNEFRKARDLLHEAEKTIQEQITDKSHALIGLTQYHLGVLLSRMHKFKKGDKLLDKAAEILDSGNVSWLSATIRCTLGYSKLSGSKNDHGETLKHFESASAQCKHALEKEADKEKVIRTMISALLGETNVLYKQKKFQEAVQHCGQILSALKHIKNHTKLRSCFRKSETLETADEDECKARVILGEVYHATKDFRKAQQEFELAYKGFKYLEGSSGLDYLHTARQLSLVYSKIPDESERAEPLMQTALRGYEQALGAYHVQTLKASWELGRLYLAQGKLSQAESACARAYQGFDETKKPDSELVVETAQTLGHVYLKLGKPSKANVLFTKTHSVICQNPRASAINKANAAMNLAQVSAILDGDDDTRRAVKLFQEAIEGYKTSKNKQDEKLSLLAAQLKLADLFRRSNRSEEAGDLLVDCLEQLENSTGPETRVYQLEAELIQVHVDVDTERDYEEKSGYIQKVNEILEKMVIGLGQNHDLTLDAKILLGELLLDLKRNDEDQGAGKDKLKEALQGYEQRNIPGHPKAIRILDRLMKNSDDYTEFQSFRKKKYQALRQELGPDAAVYIMKLTESKRPEVLEDEDGYLTDLSGPVSFQWTVSEGEVSGPEGSGPEDEGSGPYREGSLQSTDLDENSSVQSEDQITDFGSVETMSTLSSYNSNAQLSVELNTPQGEVEIDED